MPRFTSYPPATWFSADVTPETVRGWRAALPDGAEISLYLHVPFCRRLCWFCACRTQGTKTDAPLAPYVDDLLAEARQVRADLPDRVTVTRLHLGGGTPTLLPPAEMDRLLSGLAEVFGARARDEFSVEIDPTEFGPARAEVLAAHGLNRASIGVQDFDPRVQAAIGRSQSAAQTAEAVALLRGAGVEGLNIDLLYGLPHQTKESLRATLDQVLEIGPTRLALYGYAHVPWMSKRQVMIPADALPGPEARFDLFNSASHHLRAAGFAQVGIDHFARPGDGLATALADHRLARSFQGYTDDRTPTLIGLGASAISHYAQGYAQNRPGTGAWSDAVRKGEGATARGIAMTADQALRARLIEELMCYFAVDLDRIEPGERAAARALLTPLAQRYPEAISLAGDRLVLAGWARPLVRIFAAEVGGERPTGMGQASYSAAV